MLETTLEKLSSLVPGRPGAGKTADLSFMGELLVGITFGPPGFFASGEAEQVFTSMSLN
ncbi:MAG: hypothetical protein H0V55_06345 [Thermoleophilaceae bacterium]|nr:hypothetical protein [Thermoleophilaceae bacterium]